MSDISEIVIYGTSGHATILSDLAKCCKFKVIGYITEEVTPFEFNDLPARPLESWEPSIGVAIGVGDNLSRSKIFNLLKKSNRILVNLISSKAIIYPNVTFGEANVILPGSVVASNCSIGDACIVNHNATLDHDCVLNSFTHLSPGVNVAGNCTIEEGAWLGIGSSIIQHIRVGSFSTVGAGATVIHNIPSRVVVAGTPAKIIRGNIFK